MSWANRKWSKEEIEVLRQHYSDGEPKFILNLLKDRTWRGIKFQAMKLGMMRRIFTSKPHKSGLLDGSASPFDIGYIAGLIDGEGSIGFSQQRKINGYTRYRPRINVYNTDLKLMKKTQNILGGTIVKSTKAKYYYKTPYRIAVRQDDAILKTLNIILENLTTKHEQAKLIIEFIKSRQTRSLKSVYTSRERMIIKCVYELNKRSIGKW